MTKEAALYDFWSSFGITAYPSSSVPTETKFPWLTYDVVSGSWEQGNLSMTVNLWYYSTSEAEANAKAQEISEAIGFGGKELDFDGGHIWLKRGTPWCTNLYDTTDPRIKRRYLNVTVEYLSLN